MFAFYFAYIFVTNFAVCSCICSQYLQSSLNNMLSRVNPAILRFEFEWHICTKYLFFNLSATETHLLAKITLKILEIPQFLNSL